MDLPKAEAGEKDGRPPRRHRTRMISLTLLDGTTLSIPGPPKRASKNEEGPPRSDELNDQGAYQGLKQDDSWCHAGYVCFDVQFAKRPYREVMKVGSDGKVQYWHIRAASQAQ